MPNMIEQMGATYFTEKFANSFFLNDNKLYQIIGAARADRITVVDVEADDTKVLPASLFTGFKMFEYPLLGYRKFGENQYGYSHKRQTSNRGFRIEQVITTWSSCTRALMDMGLVGKSRLNDKARAAVLLKPQFDSFKTGLPLLLSGKTSGLVLNNNVLIEPSTDTANGWYSILYKQATVGSMNQRGEISWSNPAFADVVNLSNT
jgi:hypothetical protein